MGNPYLTFVALLMAGLDGIENRIDPGAPADKNLYDLPPEERGSIPEVCGSLKEALEALDKDRAFLKKGGVMDDDFIDSYIELKMEEVMRLRCTRTRSSSTCTTAADRSDQRIATAPDGPPSGAFCCADRDFNT
jgi:glutamine synthetase